MSEKDENTVYKEYYRLMAHLSAESTEAKHIKAQLRHATSKAIGENPMLWGWLVSHLDTEMQGKGGSISKEEYAIYITLSMTAIGPNNDDNTTIAEAASIAEIKRHRLLSVETASDMEEMQMALRSLVRVLASKGAAFNYGKLAEDLYYWQCNKTNIVRKWEREYARKEK